MLEGVKSFLLGLVAILLLLPIVMLCMRVGAYFMTPEVYEDKDFSMGIVSTSDADTDVFWAMTHSTDKLSDILKDLPKYLYVPKTIGNNILVSFQDVTLTLSGYYNKLSSSFLDFLNEYAARLEIDDD